MGTIEDIIKASDDKLIETGKGYLLLGQANQLLVSKDIITISEKFNKTLKKLLEENKLPHAYQTENTPRQWRIPLSKEGKLRKKIVKKKTTPKRSTQYQNPYQSQSKNTNYTICPSCGLNLFIPKGIINETYIQCLNCGKKFRNPLRNKQNYHKTDNFNITKNQRNWIIGIVVVVILIIIGNLGDNDSSSSSTLYYMNTTTYAATSKANFDEMFRYINDNDEQALSSLMLYGQMKTLSTGTEVYLVSSHFSYCIVRLRGSTQNLWVVTEHITQK